MRTISISKIGKVDVKGEITYSGQPRPQEQAQITITVEEVLCSCDVDKLESKYLNKCSGPHILGEATTAPDRALETGFFLMTNEEVAKVVICVTGKLVGMSEDVDITCTVKLEIIENAKPVYELTASDKLGIAVKYKNIGVTLFKEGLLHKQIVAFLLFSDAVKWLCMIEPKEGTENVSEEVVKLKTQCYNNIALFHLQHHNYDLCVEAATRLLGYDEGNVKALYRRAVANTEMQNYELATQDLKTALTIDPNNKSLKKQQDVIRRKEKDVDDKYATAMKKFLS